MILILMVFTSALYTKKHHGAIDIINPTRSLLRGKIVQRFVDVLHLLTSFALDVQLNILRRWPGQNTWEIVDPGDFDGYSTPETNETYLEDGSWMMFLPLFPGLSLFAFFFWGGVLQVEDRIENVSMLMSRTSWF